MRSRKVLVLAVFVVAIAAAGVAALADYDNYSDIERNPPAGSECVCPANWDPVVCKGADGSRHLFSNACVAGCYGFTKCTSFAVLEH